MSDNSSKPSSTAILTSGILLFSTLIAYKYWSKKQNRLLSSTTTTTSDNNNNNKPGLNNKEFKDALKLTGEWIVNYRDNCNNLPVMSNVKPGYLIEQLPTDAPENGEPFINILDDINRLILPGITHWSSPNFFAYFKCSCSYESILADLFSAAFNVVGFTWISSPACTELEMVVLNWMANALSLPSKFLHGPNSRGGGVIQTTASEATLVSILAAKKRALWKREEMKSKLVAYVSEHAHFSLLKDFMILDIEHVRKIKGDGNFGMVASSFKEEMKKDIEAGLIPFYLCASFGTTSTTAIDPLFDLCNVVDEFPDLKDNFWIHIDAAYGGAFLILPEFKERMQGFEKADSIVVNAHKAMLVGFDCSMFWVQDSRWLYAALSLDPNLEPYLQNSATDSGAVIDFKNWQIPLGRRFRSLKLWFLMRSFGLTGLRKHLSKSRENATYFDNLVKSNPKFISYPTLFSTSVFRYNGSNDLNREIVELSNNSACGGLDTDYINLEQAWRVLNESVKIIESKKN